MRSFSCALVGVSAMVLTVSACGGGSDDTTESTSPVPEVATVTEAPPATEAPSPTEAPPATEAVPVTEAPPMTGPVQTLEQGVLTVGSALELTPFAEADGSGNVVGFEPDLVDEMAIRLGLTVTWIDADFEGLLDDLAASQFDMVASNVTVTPERLGQFGFTNPYLWDLEGAAVSEDFANVAFPIDPANPDLQVALRETFDVMLTDGTYQSIYDTWFDTPEMSVLYEGR